MDAPQRFPDFDIEGLVDSFNPTINDDWSLQHDALGRSFIQVNNSEQCSSDINRMREIVRRSLQSCEGRLALTASNRSHIFFLQMGMLPQERETSFVQKYAGLEGLEAIENLEEGVLDQNTVTVLTNILKQYLQLTYLEKSSETILQHKDLLIQLRERRIPAAYFKDVFFPTVLKVLEKDQAVSPNTDSFGTIPMVLSEEGKRRWHECITRNRPFFYFRRFEHLNSLMSESQRLKLEEINSMPMNFFDFKRKEESGLLDSSKLKEERR